MEMAGARGMADMIAVEIVAKMAVITDSAEKKSATNMRILVVKSDMNREAQIKQGIFGKNAFAVGICVASPLAGEDVNVIIHLPPIAFPGPGFLVVIPQTWCPLFPISMMIFFLRRLVVASVGRGNGIARCSLIQDGPLRELLLFIKAFPQAGRMTTGSAAGRGYKWEYQQFPTCKFKKTGELGKGKTLGKTKLLGCP